MDEAYELYHGGYPMPVPLQTNQSPVGRVCSEVFHLDEAFYEVVSVDLFDTEARLADAASSAAPESPKLCTLLLRPRPRLCFCPGLLPSQLHFSQHPQPLLPT